MRAFNVICKVLELQPCLASFFAQSDVDALDAEVAGKSDRPIDVVAETLKKFSCLRLDNA